MIFLDANVFLRFLTGEDVDETSSRFEQARRLFASIQVGDTQVTTSEVVIHEVCYILQSKHHYERSTQEITEAMSGILAWPGFRFVGDDRGIYLRALDLWTQQPTLGFADSVIAARCERAGHELATFDRHFEAIPSVTLWQPAQTDSP